MRAVSERTQNKRAEEGRCPRCGKTSVRDVRDIYNGSSLEDNGLNTVTRHRKCLECKASFEMVYFYRYVSIRVRD